MPGLSDDVEKARRREVTSCWVWRGSDLAETEDTTLAAPVQEGIIGAKRLPDDHTSALIDLAVC